MLITLSKTRKEIVVAFRGTTNLANFVEDVVLISARNSDTPSPIKVHQGFYIATMSLYPDVSFHFCKLSMSLKHQNFIQVVRQVSAYLTEVPDAKVVITGHSLGGAMARQTYFFLDDRNQFPVNYELYTYGEPRGGNKAYADYMNSRTIFSARVVARCVNKPEALQN